MPPQRQAGKPALRLRLHSSAEFYNLISVQMSLKSEINLINSEMEVVKEIFLATLNLLPSFNITDSTILPYGLRAHTRSISWIAEQAIAQQAKLNAEKLGISDVKLDFGDTDIVDCIIINGENHYPINIKIFQTPLKKTKNDIASLTKLYEFYNQNPSNRIIYACFGFRFDGLSVKFSNDKDNLIVFSPQFANEFYNNSGNNKIQFKYKHNPVERTRDEFLKILKPEYDALIGLRKKRKEAKKNAKRK